MAFGYNFQTAGERWIAYKEDLPLTRCLHSNCWNSNLNYNENRCLTLITDNNDKLNTSHNTVNGKLRQHKI